MSYPPQGAPPQEYRPRSRSRGNSSASTSRYTPNGYGVPPAQQAAQSGGYLAPGLHQQPLAMPEPDPAYQPSQLTYNAPVAGMPYAPPQSTSYTGSPAGAGSPPYPTAPSAVPEYLARPAANARRHSQSSQRSHRSHHSHHSHHSSHDHRRSEEYDRDRYSHEHNTGHRHSHQDYEPEHSSRHHHHATTPTKPLTRADTRRPTLGDTVMSLVDGMKRYISK